LPPADHSMISVLETRVVQGSGGGPDKTILNSPRFLRQYGFRTLCAYMHPPEDPGFANILARAQAWKAPVISVPDRGPLDWKVLPALLNICRRERIAIWHGHDYKSNLLGLLVRRFWPMKLVTTLHGWVHNTRRTPVYYWIDRACLPHYDQVICVSDDLHDRCLQLGLDAERCVLIENGIDTAEFSRHMSRQEAKSRLHVPPTRAIIGAVGRLSSEKGFDVLLHSVDQLLADGLDVELWILGEGNERHNLENLIARLGRQDRVHLLGFRQDLREYYQAMDVFALSSYREGLPNVVLEAMAFAVPVVATRIAGLPKVIAHGKNGLLVDPGDPEALKRCLGQVLRCDGLQDQLGREGRKTVEERFSFQARMDRIRCLYAQLLSREHRRPQALARNSVYHGPIEAASP
jgi:glycosyltransferase involved in cell wall biosynthesis